MQTNVLLLLLLLLLLWLLALFLFMFTNWCMANFIFSQFTFDKDGKVIDSAIPLIADKASCKFIRI